MIIIFLQLIEQFLSREKRRVNFPPEKFRLTIFQLFNEMSNLLLGQMLCPVSGLAPCDFGLFQEVKKRLKGRQFSSDELLVVWDQECAGLLEETSLTEKYYSKLFGEPLFKTIKNYSNYSPMLNYIYIYMCCRGRAYLKQEFLLNFIKNIQQKNLSTAEFILDSYFVIRHG